MPRSIRKCQGPCGVFTCGVAGPTLGFHCWQGVLHWRTWRPGKVQGPRWTFDVLICFRNFCVNWNHDLWIKFGGKKGHPCSMSGFETYKKCQNRLDRDTDMPWYIYIGSHICVPSVSNRWFCSYPKSGCCSSTCWFHQKAHRLLPHSDTYLYYVVGCLGRPSLSLFICTWPALAVQKQWDHRHTQNSWSSLEKKYTVMILSCSVIIYVKICSPYISWIHDMFSTWWIISRRTLAELDASLPHW